MPRKILDIQPIITARFSGGGIVTTEADARAQVEDALALLGEDFECTVAFETDDRCEFCNSAWTEAGSDYNAGCCARDDANDPVRIVELRELIDAVYGGDFVRMEEDRRASRTTCDWPDALAAAARTWLDADRPADGIAVLKPLIDRVSESDWGMWWDDPGVYPSNAGAAPLPSRCEARSEPGDLASALESLIDDMGLAPAKAAA